MTKEDYEKADNLSKDALSDFELDNNPLKWLEKYASLYKVYAICNNLVIISQLCFSALSFFLQLGSFHGKYEKLMRDHEFTITDL